MAERPNHKHLLEDDPEVRRWYNNLARGSVVTAEERLRRLGRMCALFAKTPRRLADDKRSSPGEFDNFVMGFVDDSLAKGQKPTYVRNNLVTLRSWLGHFGLRVDKKIKLPSFVVRMNSRFLT